jgi:hypothetical protein
MVGGPSARMSGLWQLDTVIGQLADAMRILLSIDRDGKDKPPGDTDMNTEASTLTTNDRYDVLVVEKYEDDQGAEKSNWTRVGVAFPHKDGNGLNVELRAIPVSGKLVIRRHDVKSKSADG